MARGRAWLHRKPTSRRRRRWVPISSLTCHLPGLGAWRPACPRRAGRARRVSADGDQRTGQGRGDPLLDGLFPGVADGTKYRFFVVGPGGAGFKRDPWARELELEGYPDCDCIVRDPNSYPWHDQGWRSPAFRDLIVYQFHVGVSMPAIRVGTTAAAIRRISSMSWVGSSI